MRFLFVAVILLSFLLASPSVQSSYDKIKTIEIKGYVTQIHGPSSFEIDEYKMSLDGKYDVELQNVEDKALKFDPAQHLKIGTLVKIKSKVNTETLEGSVSEIKIDFKQFRRLSHTTVLDSSPTELTREADGKWSGSIVADARKILITPETDVRFRLNKSEEREAKEKKRQEEEERESKKDQEKAQKEIEEQEKQLANRSEDEDEIRENSVEELRVGAKPLESLDQVEPGVYMTYKGQEDFSGRLVASDIVFVKNEKTKQEMQLWQKLRIKEKESKKSNSFDTMKIAGEKYKVLPEDEIQDYVNDLGRSLVPEYQKQLPDDDENKIPFRFVVINEREINAGAYATGTIVINHDVFNYLENEAQLAFLLSHEIAHTTQEHTVRQLNHKKKTRTWLRIGAVASYAMGYGLLAQTFAATEQAMAVGYARSIENQADRIGLANMINYGYDPREAPRLWKVAAMHFGDKKTNFFWSTHSSNAERRSYLWLTIRNTYPSLDYSEVKKDSIRFQQIAGMIREKYPAKSKRKGD